MPAFTYDSGRYFRDGEPFFVVAADYQYYRDRRDNWSDRLDQLKAAHVNVITFYTPWRHHIQHDPEDGAISYDFRGETLDSRDLVRFMDLCADKGLLMIAKPGPFVHSELNIGGLPDAVSPSFNPEIEPVRMHDGAPLRWEYDNTQLPSPDDPIFDSLARAWLEEIGRVLAPHAGRKGKLIGIQLLDETLYCTSNDPPWRFGYEPASMQRFHQRLRTQYSTIAEYNRLHRTGYRGFSFVRGPVPRPGEPVSATREGLLSYIDWAEHQWRLRRDAYALYREYLGLNRPYLSNFAGITPPIDENVPGQQDAGEPDIPTEYAQLYPEWWFAQNRVGADREVYHYGMISWLGVAAYNVADASAAPGDDVGDNEVFHRYLTTARRRRGINMEENWGFSKLYHPLSEFPIIPVFQTLVSLAGGCTGYVVFTGVCHDYWTEDLDRTTKKQHPTFPADAPIGPKGETGEMYEAMRLLNEYFAREGESLLRAEPEPEVCLLLIPEYAAISSWVPDESAWALDHEIPRLGTGAIEPATTILNRNGVTFKLAELDSMREESLAAQPLSILKSAFFLAKREQHRLVEHVQNGGRLILTGELPRYDEQMEPCTVLADFAGTRPAGLFVHPGNILADEELLLTALREAGWQPRLQLSEGLQACVHHGSDRDKFVFFFHFGREADAERQVAIDGMVLHLTVGPKTCGVVHLSGERIVSYLVKAHNEYEGVEAAWRMACGDSDISGTGDGSGFDL